MVIAGRSIVLYTCAGIERCLCMVNGVRFEYSKFSHPLDFTAVIWFSQY